MSTTLPLLDSEISSAIRKRLGELCVSKDARQIKLPLRSVKIEGTIADRIAEVTVEQEFHNPYSEPLEAVYIYPLSGGCAVSSFQLKVGDQIIVGKVEERQKARQDCQQALAQGKRAALLEQERDDVFTVTLGNLPAGDCVSVTVKYSEKLPYYDNGTTELRLPLVVASRYIPGTPLDRDQVGAGTECDTDQVPDASRITPPRLAQGVNPNIDLSIKVRLLNNNSIEDLSCSQHATRLSADPSSATISLSRTDELLDRDFVLRWKIAGEVIKPRFLVYSQSEKGKPSFGMLSLVPPKNVEMAMPVRDIIFLLDRSGSMQGIKMVSAVRACSYLIAALGPKDRFAILSFDTAFEWMPTKNSDHFVTADEAGIEFGAKHLRTVDARGGTELNGAVLQALQAMKNRSGNKKSARLPVVVVLTDGEVGNESAILKNIQTELSDNRIFTVGIDNAVNDGFLRKLAAIAGGTCTFVQPGTQLEEALNQVGREIGRVLVTDIKLACTPGQISKDSIAPSRIPDLYEGRATACFFQLDKLAQDKDATIEISGTFADGSAYDQKVKAERVEISALAQLWAKAHVSDLEDQFRIATTGHEHDRLKNEIVRLAVEHTLLTKFTAFVAIHEEEAVSDPSKRRTVVQAVHEAQGWEDGSAMAQSMRMRSMPMSMPAPAPQSAAGWGSAPASGGAHYDSGKIGSIGKFILSDDDQLKIKQLTANDWGAPQSAPQQAPQPAQGQGSSQPPAEAAAPPLPPKSPPSSLMGQLVRQRASHQEPLFEASSRANSSGGDNSTKVAQTFEILDELLRQAYEDIKADKVPDGDKIEKARTALLEALAASSIAAQLPLLQKFLRATLVQLIAASGAQQATPQLKELGRLHEESWKQVQSECTDIFNQKTKPFWEFSI